MGRGPGRGRLCKSLKGTWVGYWSDHTGTRRSRDLGPRKADAEKLLAAEITRRDKIRAGLPGESGLKLPLRELVDMRLSYLQARGKTTAAIRREASAAGQFLKVTAARTALDVTPAVVHSYQAARRRSGVSNRTINIDLAVMQRVFKHALRLGILERNPLAVYEALPTTESHRVKDRRPLTVEETERLLAASTELDEERGGFPQTPLFRMYLLTGARRQELLDTVWRDVDWEAQTLTLAAGNTKANRRRVVDLSERGVQVLESVWHPDHPPTSPIFRGRRGAAKANHRTLLKTFYQALERADIERVDQYGLCLDIHALRTTFGSRMAEAGVELADLQKLMDHASPVTTAMYYAKPRREAVAARVRAIGGFDAVSAGV